MFDTSYELCPIDTYLSMNDTNPTIDKVPFVDYASNSLKINFEALMKDKLVPF